MSRISVGSALDAGAPAMRIILGWSGREIGRRIVGTLCCRCAPHLHGRQRDQKQPFESVDLHPAIKVKPRQKRKLHSRPRGSFASRRSGHAGFCLGEGSDFTLVTQPVLGFAHPDLGLLRCQAMRYDDIMSFSEVLLDRYPSPLVKDLFGDT